MVGWRTPKNPIICKRCGNQFWRKYASQDYCQSCRQVARGEYNRVYHRAYYLKHTAQFKASSKRSRERNIERYRRDSRERTRRHVKAITQRVLDYYSNGTFRCACCGEAQRDFLTLDHVAGFRNYTLREPRVPRAGTQLYTWLARHNFPEGFQILCMNCNLSKAKHGHCIHRDTTSR